jgi:hypothetical protein
MRQLADLATMHLIMDIKSGAEKASASDSILTLLADRQDTDALPLKMSVVDRAMLRGLYQYRDNALSGTAQRGIIATEIKKQEQKQQAEQQPQ